MKFYFSFHAESIRSAIKKSRRRSRYEVFQAVPPYKGADEGGYLLCLPDKQEKIPGRLEAIERWRAKFPGDQSEERFVESSHQW